MNKFVKNNLKMILLIIILWGAFIIYIKGNDIEGALDKVGIQVSSMFSSSNTTALIVLNCETKRGLLSHYDMEYYINNNITPAEWERLISSKNFSNKNKKDIVIKEMKGFREVNADYYRSIENESKYKYKTELKVVE